LIEQGLMSHQTHQPTVSKHWRKTGPKEASIPSGPSRCAHSNTTTMQYEKEHTKYTQINRNKSVHCEIVPLWQNPIQRTVRTAHLSVLMTVHSFSTLYNTEQFW